MSSSGARQTVAPLVKFSLFALVTIAATALLAATIVNVSFTPKDTYHAVFTDVTGLESGDDIRVAGVRVGQVEGIRIKDRTLAEVTFMSAPAVRCSPGPTRSSATATWSGSGTSHSLRAPATSPPYAAGGTIPLSRTQPALDLNALLNGFKPLFAALSPSDVNQLATEIVQTLQGEGGTVNSLLAHTASLTSTLADRDKLIGSVIDNLNTVLETLDKRGSRFSALLTQLRRVVAGLSRPPAHRGVAGEHRQPHGRHVGAAEGRAPTAEGRHHRARRSDRNAE